jgi:hypothetical protein
MVLPKEMKTEKVMAINAAITKMTPQELAALPQLDADDFRLFGIIAQTYCFIDLNLRRALEVMKLAKRLPSEHVKRYPNYSDAELAGILKQTVQAMDPKTERHEESLLRLEEIDRCRSYRNLLSHFAGKRYPGEDVYVFASKSERDARKVLGRDLAKHRVHFAVTGRTEFFELAKLLDGHQVWLSMKIPEWDERYLKPNAQET